MLRWIIAVKYFAPIPIQIIKYQEIALTPISLVAFLISTMDLLKQRLFVLISKALPTFQRDENPLRYTVTYGTSAQRRIFSILSYESEYQSDAVEKRATASFMISRSHNIEN